MMTILTTTIMTTVMTMILRLDTYGIFSAGGKYFLLSGHLSRVSFVLHGVFLAFMFVYFLAGAVGAVVFGWLTLGEMSPVKPMRL